MNLSARLTALSLTVPSLAGSSLSAFQLSTF
jgi:hypothetical protein